LGSTSRWLDQGEPMAVEIRLTKAGKKKLFTYRVVVADRRHPKEGGVLERVGMYDPKRKPPLLVLKRERIEYWIGKGARPTPTVGRLLKRPAPPAPEEKQG
jgi:small subunit ribosomal protein S16